MEGVVAALFAKCDALEITKDSSVRCKILALRTYLREAARS